MRLKNFLIITFALALIFQFQFFSLKACAQLASNERPLFVTISTSWCFACKIVHPITQELKKKYDGKVTFVDLDASSEITLKDAAQIAKDYGVSDFFNRNKNAFPTIGILCPGGLGVEKVIVGARGQEAYESVLDDLLLNTSKICSLNGRPQGQDNEPARPSEPEVITVSGSRPEEPNFLDRPKEVLSSGRPDELRFWTYGQPMSPYTYYYLASLKLPLCSGSNQILCYNGKENGSKESNATDGPIFKPWTPDATRNEKGFNNIAIKDKDL